MKPGASWRRRDTIQTFVEGHRFSVVRDFCGHGIGRRFHEPPNVLHFGRPGEGPVLRAGMFFTVEPMVNAGRPEVKVLDDGWTAVTRDRSLRPSSNIWSASPATAARCSRSRLPVWTSRRSALADWQHLTARLAVRFSLRASCPKPPSRPVWPSSRCCRICSRNRPDQLGLRAIARACGRGC